MAAALGNGNVNLPTGQRERANPAIPVNVNISLPA